MAYDLSVSQQKTRDEIGVEDNIRFIPKRFSESAHLTVQATKVQETDINNTFIIGHPVNGVIGVTSPQNLLGDYRTDGALLRVFSPNNTFVEKFRHKEYINTTVSNGTRSTTYPGTYALASSKTLQSETIYRDSTNGTKVYSANVTITTSGSTPSMFMTADGETSWGYVSNNTITFVDTAEAATYGSALYDSCALFLDTTSNPQ